MRKYDLRTESDCVILSQEGNYYVLQFLLGAGLVIFACLVLFLRDHDSYDVGLIAIIGSCFIGIIGFWAFFNSSKNGEILRIELRTKTILVHKRLQYSIDEVGTICSIHGGGYEFQDTKLVIKDKGGKQLFSTLKRGAPDELDQITKELAEALRIPPQFVNGWGKKRQIKS